MSENKNNICSYDKNKQTNKQAVGHADFYTFMLDNDLVVIEARTIANLLQVVSLFLQNSCLREHVHESVHSTRWTRDRLVVKSLTNMMCIGI